MRLIAALASRNDQDRLLLEDALQYNSSGALAQSPAEMTIIIAVIRAC